MTEDPRLPPRGLRKRVRTRWKASVFNPHYLEKRLLWRSISAEAPALSGRMLDAGCGDRPYARLFAHVTRYVGMEHPGAVQNVESALRVSFQRLRGVVDCFGDAEGVPFADASFDACLCTEVLEHVSDPLRVVRELARVLRPGGRALITVPFAGGLHQVPYDFRRFTPYGLRQVVEQGGLEVERLHGRGNLPLVCGVVTAHAIYRMGARRTLPDGSVSLAWWAIPCVCAGAALVQSLALLVGAFSKDESYCVGYLVVARKP